DCGQRHVLADGEVVYDRERYDGIGVDARMQAGTLDLRPTLGRARIGGIQKKRKKAQLPVGSPRHRGLERVEVEIESDDRACIVAEKNSRIFAAVAADVPYAAGSKGAGELGDEVPLPCFIVTDIRTVAVAVRLPVRRSDILGSEPRNPAVQASQD